METHLTTLIQILTQLRDDFAFRLLSSPAGAHRHTCREHREYAYEVK